MTNGANRIHKAVYISVGGEKACRAELVSHSYVAISARDTQSSRAREKVGLYECTPAANALDSSFSAPLDFVNYLAIVRHVPGMPRHLSSLRSRDSPEKEGTSRRL